MLTKSNLTAITLRNKHLVALQCSILARCPHLPTIWEGISQCLAWSLFAPPRRRRGLVNSSDGANSDRFNNDINSLLKSAVSQTVNSMAINCLCVNTFGIVTNMWEYYYCRRIAAIYSSNKKQDFNKELYKMDQDYTI